MKINGLSFPFYPLQATFVFSLVRWSPLSLGKGLVAPVWATTLGWLLTLSSVSLLPIWAIYALVTTPGTLPQVIPAHSLLCLLPRTADVLLTLEFFLKFLKPTQ